MVMLWKRTTITVEHSTPLFSQYPSYPYPHQHAVQTHFLIPEKAAVLVTEPVSSLLEPFKTKMVLEEAQDPRVMVRKENVGGVRRRCRDNHWKNKRNGREGFISADSTQASKKKWRAKPSSYSTGDNKHFDRNADQTSFEYPREVQGWAANNNREKHPLIPLKSDGKETTVMIRNIPNRYTYDLLVSFIFMCYI